jgi:hypothetical protein
MILNKVLIMGYPKVPWAIESVLVTTEAEINALVQSILVPHPYYVLSATARGGFSGAPVINEEGHAIVAAELQAVCQSNDWQFCFIGGLALQRWSEPRETVDVDLSLLAGFGDEQQFCDVLLKHFAARISDAERMKTQPPF